jgi:hypothetical protein
MRITAAEVIEKKALMPGAGGQPAQRPKPAGPMAPQAPEPQQGAPAGGAPQGDPAAQGGQPQDPSQGNQDLQAITQNLLNDYFDDRRIAEVSEQVQQLIPLVGPEHAEKFVKVFSDWIKAAQVLKANLMAMVVMATPAKMMENQMSTMMNQLMNQSQQQQGPQPMKVPLT